MPPKKKISAPQNRVYESIPVLHQTKFPAPKKRINSYGKKPTPRRFLKQDSTLTQIWGDQLEFDEDEGNLNEEEDGVPDLQDEEPQKPEKGRRRRTLGDMVSKKVEPAPKSAKAKRKWKKLGEEEDSEEEDLYVEESEKRKKRRRRTAGDDLEKDETEKRKKTRRRKTLGDEPSPHAEFHTQTLTQMPSWSSTAQEEEAEEDDGIFDVPDRSSQVLLPHRRNPPRGSRASTSPAKAVIVQATSTPGSMRPPQTPRRKFPLEIPSSESPASPILFGSSARKRTPLRELGANAAVPFSTDSKPSSIQLPRSTLRIEDTFDSEETDQHTPTTPSKKTSSPAKSVRFAIPNSEEIGAEESSLEGYKFRSSPPIQGEPVPTQPSATQQSPNQDKPEIEILDSDAESDLDYEEKDPTPNEEENDEESSSMGPDTCYGGIGLETQQLIIDEIMPSAESTQREASQDLDKATQKSQWVEETQRLSTQQVLDLAPQTTNSDIFISLHPPHVKNIVNRTKDHEFRSWIFPETVVRIWIYETAPKSTLTYMASIGPPKRLGNPMSSTGIGNAEFSKRRADCGEYAYEILQLYKLGNPLTLAELKAKEWMKGPPQKMQWVQPAVLGELVANIIRPLFGQETPAEEEEVPTSSSTDTQEIAAQLSDTIEKFTQPARFAEGENPSSSFVPESQPEEDEKTPQESLPCPFEDSHHMPRPSQAETVDLDLSDFPTPRKSLPEVIWESPTRPTLSSTPSLPTPRPGGFEEADNPVPFSMQSSQLLTKSQMLPDSLLHDSIPGPPLFVQDSEDDDD